VRAAVAMTASVWWFIWLLTVSERTCTRSSESPRKCERRQRGADIRLGPPGHDDEDRATFEDGANVVILTQRLAGRDFSGATTKLGLERLADRGERDLVDDRDRFRGRRPLRHPGRSPAQQFML